MTSEWKEIYYLLSKFYYYLLPFFYYFTTLQTPCIYTLTCIYTLIILKLFIYLKINTVKKKTWIILPRTFTQGSAYSTIFGGKIGSFLKLTSHLISMKMQFPKMLVFCGNCYLRNYLAFKLFIPYAILKKLRFQYFLSIPCYKKKQNI